MERKLSVARKRIHLPLNTTHSRQTVTLDIYCLAGDTGIDWTYCLSWLLAYQNAELAA
jgi:hypothetical protein